MRTVIRPPLATCALLEASPLLEPRRALRVRLVWLTWTPTRPLSATLALLAATTPLPALRHARCARMRVLRNQYRSRKRLLIDDQVAIYHIVTRTTCQQFLFGPEEREVFCNLLMKQAGFSGVEVLSYCVMSNHVHLLLQINPDAKPSDPEMLRRYENYYGTEKVPLSAYSVSELKAILTEGGPTADKERARVLARMNDLPAFMRELKQRFSIWYNHKHENTGTIWSARYKSLIVENSPETLTRVAAYIDLNPIRAGIVTDPKDYRWCSYSAGLAGQP